MTTKGEQTRARLVESMLALIQIRGYAGTGLMAVAEHAHAPKGSLYFHFPDGKESLGAAAVELAAQTFEQLIADAAQEERTPGRIVHRVIEALIDLLTTSDFQLGCPVSVVTLETSAESDRLRASCAAAFESWIAPVAAFLVDNGAPADLARERATVLVSTVEGAVILSRAQRSIIPLRYAAMLLADLVDAGTTPARAGARR